MYLRFSKPAVARRLLGLGAGAALAACGGGGGGSGGAAPVTTAPTPTPSPSASPTATPSPSISYVSPTDFTRGFSLQGRIGYETTTFLPDAGPTGLTFEAALLAVEHVLTWSAIQEMFDLRFGTASIRLGMAERIDSEPRPINLRTYRRGDDIVGLGPSENGVTYVNFVNWRRPIARETRDGRLGSVFLTSIALVGETTAAADTVTPIANYTGRFGIEGVVPGQINDGASLPATFTVNGTGVSGTVQMFGQAIPGRPTVPRQTLRFAGTLDRASYTISGTVSDGDDATASGAFAGRLFGPAGANLGLAFRLSRTSDRAVYAGHFMAAR